MLEVENPSLLLDRTSRLLKIIASLPKIQQFVSDVCEIVLCKGASHIPLHLRPSVSGDIPNVVCGMRIGFRGGCVCSCSIYSPSLG